MAAVGLRRMLEARSVAVVGASRQQGSVGAEVLRQLLDGGFDGDVFPVNPRYDEVAGLRCMPALSELDEPVDLAILAVGNAHLEQQLTAAADAGAGAAVIFASGHSVDVNDTSLRDRLRAIAIDVGMAVCGGNGMGFVNLERGLRASAYPQPLDLPSGPVAFLTHSGSLFTSLLHNRRQVHFNLAVSTGQELVTTIADYLAYAVAQPSTRVVGLFVESVRDPDGFVAALRTAAERDIAVVALTVGRHDATRSLVTAHSGALAGSDGGYEAVFDAYGVHRVRSFDELLDTMAMFAAGRRAAPGGVAALHDSGGERAHLLDVALDSGVRLASPDVATRAALAEVLDPGLPVVNPLDAWGSSRGYHETLVACGRALLDDADTAGLLFCVDLPDIEDDDAYPAIARELHAATDKPVAVLANVPGALNDAVADRLRAHGIVVLEGTATGLAAFSHLMAHRDRRPWAPPAARSRGALPPEMVDGWRMHLDLPGPWTEIDALELLDGFGVPTVTRAIAETEDAAVRAAVDIGMPVVLKTALAVAHKSDVGAVRLDLRDEPAVRSAYRALADAFGPRVLVARMVSDGVELAVGVVTDPTFGPLVVLGAGGVLVELIGDRRVALPGFDRAQALRLLEGLRIAPLLRGARGRPPVDLDAVADAIVSMSTLASTLGDRLAAVDVNPLICGPDGCVAVDALVIPRGAITDA